jgi:hypothetical protein
MEAMTTPKGTVLGADSGFLLSTMGCAESAPIICEPFVVLPKAAQAIDQVNHRLLADHQGPTPWTVQVDYQKHDGGKHQDQSNRDNPIAFPGNSTVETQHE